MRATLPGKLLFRESAAMKKRSAVACAPGAVARPFLLIRCIVVALAGTRPVCVTTLFPLTLPVIAAK